MDWVLQIVLEVAGLVAIAWLIDRTLRWHGARIRLRLGVWALLAAWFATALAAQVSSLWFCVGVILIFGVLLTKPDDVINRTGGPIPLVLLGLEVERVGVACAQFGRLPEGRERDDAGAEILASLGKLRGPARADIDDYLRLFCESVAHWVASTPWPDGATKRERLYELERTFRGDLDRAAVGTKAWGWNRSGGPGDP